MTPWKGITNKHSKGRPEGTSDLILQFQSEEMTINLELP